MTDFDFKEKYGLSDLRKIVRILRSPGGCPWDIEQTHGSIKNDFVEEVYEVVDAIDRDSAEDLCEELGDVLLQVFFHSSLAEDDGRFNIDDVADGICKKLIYRHPHVFGDISVKNSTEVLDNWDRLKRVEKDQASYGDTLQSVPKAFPALMRAAKVQKRAEKSGLPLPEPYPVNDMKNEAVRLLDILLDGEGDKLKALGDLLFLIIMVSRAKGVDAEEALTAATDRFIADFVAAEEK